MRFTSLVDFCMYTERKEKVNITKNYNIFGVNYVFCCFNKEANIKP